MKYLSFCLLISLFCGLECTLDDEKPPLKNEDELEAYHYLYHVNNLLENGNRSYGAALAKEYVDKKINQTTLTETEETIKNFLFQVYMKIIYPKLLNSTALDMPKEGGDGYFPPCNREAEIHRPVVVGKIASNSHAIAKITLLAFGAFMNPVGIWTLLKRDKKSICNYLTIALFVSEMGYIIVSGGAIAVRGQAVTKDVFLTHLYGHLLLPLRTCFITSSIVLTLLLSYHRYRSINDPHNYYAEQQVQNKPRKAMKLAFWTFAGSLIVNLSVFFEPIIVLNTHEYWNLDEYNNSFYTIEDSWKVVPTQWRWSLVNIYLYHGVIEALASLLLPFLAVTYFTLMTCIRLWQRKKNMATTFGTGGNHATYGAALNQATNQNHNNAASMQEVRKVVVLMSIVIFLGIGYVARFALTIDEVISITIQLIRNRHGTETPRNCFMRVKRHSQMNRVSNYILTFNAAFVALVYALLDTQFAQEMLKSLMKFFGCFNAANPVEENGSQVGNAGNNAETRSLLVLVATNNNSEMLPPQSQPASSL